MEEKKFKNPSMHVEGTQSNTEPQPSYDQLKDAYYRAAQFNQALIKENQELRQNMALRRLDYLFKVIELVINKPNTVFNHDFVADCANEIQEALTVAPPSNSEDNSAKQ